MKKHFKFLSIIVLALLIPLCFLATGCITGSSLHHAGAMYGHDANFHWKTCVCEKSDCTEKYNISAHSWVDGSPITTSTETTTPQMCACGATNSKITRTDDQVKALFTKLCNEYYSGNRSFTISGSGEFHTYNSETKETMFSLGMGRVKIVKDNNAYKYYRENDETYSIVDSEDLVELLQNNGSLGLWHSFSQSMEQTGSDVVIIKNTNTYSITFDVYSYSYTMDFNAESILTVSLQDGGYAVVTNTFDANAFNAFDTSGYTLSN